MYRKDAKRLKPQINATKSVLGVEDIENLWIRN
jgi:hypothetical protein